MVRMSSQEAEVVMRCIARMVGVKTVKQSQHVVSVGADKLRSSGSTWASSSSLSSG